MCLEPVGRYGDLRRTLLIPIRMMSKGPWCAESPEVKHHCWELLLKGLTPQMIKLCLSRESNAERNRSIP